MLVEKYFKYGDLSSEEGLRVKAMSYDDEKEDIPSSNEITKEEYDAVKEMMKNPEQKRGYYGIVNDEGYAKYLRCLEIERENAAKAEEEENRKSEEKINLMVKKIKKLLALEVIDESDIDLEIEMSNMTAYAEEIKKRLEN